MLFKILIGVCHQNDIVELAEICIFLSLSAHIYHTVLEASPVLSDNQDAAVFQCIYHTFARRRQIIRISREDSPSIRTDPGFDRLFYRTHPDLIARLRNIKLCFCDPLILPDIVKGLFFVYGEHTVLQRQFVSEYNVSDIEIANLKFHIFPPCHV